MTATEIECPICDRKVQSDVDRCPNCGSDLTMSSFEDLEEVARKLSTKETQRPPEVKADTKEPIAQAKPKVEVRKAEAPALDKKEETRPAEQAKKEVKSTIDQSKEESKHGIGRLFGKKKK